MSNSGEEAMTYLRKCLDLEPYHAEANLMYASLMVNEFGNRLNLERYVVSLSDSSVAASGRIMMKRWSIWTELLRHSTAVRTFPS